MQDSKQDSGKHRARLTLRGWPVPNWVLWTTGILALYTVLGFFLLPWVAERQLTNLAAERLDLELGIERLYFNPYTMLLEIEELRAADTDQSPLLELGLLRANFSPLRLVLLKLHFTEFQVADLDLYFTRATTTTNTATLLAQRWQASAEPGDEPAPPEPAGDEPGGIVPLEVDVTRLSNLKMHIRDEVPDEPFATVLTLASAQVDGLSSIEERSADKSVLFRFANDASLEWSGDLQLNPIGLSGQLALDGFTLDMVDHYVRQSLPFSLNDGRLDVAMDYDLALDGEAVQISLNEIVVELSELAVTQAGASDPFLSAGVLRIENGSLAYPDNVATLDAVSLSGLNVHAIRDAEGVINLRQLAAEFAGDGSTAETGAAASNEPDADNNWDLQLNRFALNNSQIDFEDNALAEPASLSTSVALELSDISNEPGALMPLDLQLAPASGGELTVTGSTGFLPNLTLEADAQLTSLDLTVLQPYLSEFTFLNLNSGAIGADLALTVDPDALFRLQGGLELQQFSTADQQFEETILTWNNIAVDGIDLEMASDTLEISELILDELFARVVINEDGSTNIGRSIKTAAQEEVADALPEPDEPDATSSPASTLPLDIIVGRITINNARSDFTDRNLPIVFNANIRELNGSADGFSTQSTEPLSLDLEGNVDEFGQLQFSSAVNPFDVTAQSEVRLQFRNLDLPSVSPYTIKFAGREIDDGNVDIDLEYEVNAGALAANNRVVLRNLELGARIEQPGAMNLPLDLATALLKDSNGVIDLEVPVSGNVDDPEFDLGPAIRTAIGNVIGNIVAAPFRLLGSLVGSADAELDRIQFEPGRSAVAPPEREVLTQLVSALTQRPELVLEIPLLQGEGDRTALQEQAVTARINTQLEQTTEADGSLTDRRRNIIERLYQEAALTPALEELRLANTLTTEAPEDGTVDLAEALTASGELDVPAYVQDMRARLVAAEAVSEQALASLAEARAEAVRSYLAEQGLDSDSRTVAGDMQSSELNDNERLTMEFGLAPQRR